MTKSPETAEGKGLAKTPAKKRSTKAEAKPIELETPVAAAVEVKAAEKPAAKRGRKPKTAAEPAPEVPAPAPETPRRREDIQLTPQTQAILQAIEEGRAVEFIFSDPDANPPRTFEPRQLVFDVFTKAWFVWGWDRRYNAERHHRVDLLAEVNAVEGVGRAAQGPFKEGTPGNQIGGWLGGEPIPVKAILLKQWIYAVKQAPAVFPDFKLEDLEEGKAQVTFVGTDLRAIARWCMQFGDGIQVLEPQRLIDRIKQVGVTWAGKPVQAAAPQPSPKPAPEPARTEHPRRAEHPRHEREPREHHEHREHREHREPKETEAPKPKNGKIEIRFDRL
jgi:predicted DNA-binding transcriptional regulator YafY